jgi:hypothetical protein
MKIHVLIQVKKYNRTTIAIFIFLASYQIRGQGLERYLVKSKVITFQFLIGPSLIGVRGRPLESSSTSFGGYLVPTLTTTGGYSFGIGLTHNIGRHFEILLKGLWDQKGYIQGLDSISIASSGAITLRQSIWTQGVKT